jgi:hypothetical protein
VAASTSCAVPDGGPRRLQRACLFVVVVVVVVVVVAAPWHGSDDDDDDDDDDGALRQGVLWLHAGAGAVRNERAAVTAATPPQHRRLRHGGQISSARSAAAAATQQGPEGRAPLVFVLGTKAAAWQRSEHRRPTGRQWSQHSADAAGMSYSQESKKKNNSVCTTNVFFFDYSEPQQASLHVCT